MIEANYSILIVDDNEMNRDLLSRRLTRQGYKVSIVSNGVEALEAVRSQKFNLMLLDVMMPEMNGYQVLEQLKANGELNAMPVIMISALDEQESIERCLELGASDYLTKPFNPMQLKTTVVGLLEKYKHD